MPENDPNLPKVLDETGVVAWELPRAVPRSMQPHRHEQAQLCGLKAGLAVVETDAGSWLCPPGRCVWIPPGVLHAQRSIGKISGWVLHMRAGLCERLPSAPAVLSLEPLLKEIVTRVVGWVAEPEGGAARQQLVAVLQDEIAGASQVQLHLPFPADPALKRLALRLATSVDAPKGFSKLAHEVGLSERSLFRGFQRDTGLSPVQWRRQMQVLRSLELLTDGRSVTETSLEVGYESTGAFIRAFRQVVGVTPSAYAQQQR